jgi:CBS domain-containing protein
MTTVRELLAEKPHELYTVAPEATVLEALRLMAEHGIGALPVVRDGRLLGIVSERDYARKVVLLGRASHATPVAEIMTKDPLTVAPGTTVDTCMALVTEQRHRHLPVLERGRLAGIVSIGDLVKAVIEDQRQQLDQLQRYIAG